MQLASSGTNITYAGFLSKLNTVIYLSYYNWHGFFNPFKTDPTKAEQACAAVILVL